MRPRAASAMRVGGTDCIQRRRVPDDVSPARPVCLLVLTREQIARYERDAEISTLTGCAKLRVHRNECHRSFGIHIYYFCTFATHRRRTFLNCMAEQVRSFG